MATALKKANKNISKQLYRRVFKWTFLIFVLLVIVVQLLYPSDRGLPLAKVADQQLSFATHGEMAKVITEQFDKTTIKLTIGPDKVIEYPLKLAGAEPDTEHMISELSDYSFLQRLVPGTLFRTSARLPNTDVYYTVSVLEKFSSERSKDFSFPSRNARLSIENDGTLTTSEAMAGSSVTSSQIQSAISHAKIKLGQSTTIPIAAKRESPQRTVKDLMKVRTEAEKMLSHVIVINIGGQKFTPDKSEVASWIVLGDGTKEGVTLTFDRQKLLDYLQKLNEKVGVPAGQTNVTIIDGREVGREVGTLGKTMDVTALAAKIEEGLRNDSPRVAVDAHLIDLQPGVIYNSKYTATQAGLQSYLNDMASQKNMFFSIKQLDGERWSAAARDTESIPSGSTFKLYVALVLFDKIDKGEIKWTDPILDTDVAGCFERMTVASTNPCAEKWIAEFGRQYINDFIYARGFSQGTTFIASDATHTTASDLTKFMMGLNDGTLVGGANRERLLDSLGRHPYRYGIPTGSKGNVHDKVGFLWDYVHDTAIVQHPRGTYIMTILTKGQSYGAIASATREIERIMYP